MERTLANGNCVMRAERLARVRRQKATSSWTIQTTSYLHNLTLPAVHTQEPNQRSAVRAVIRSKNSILLECSRERLLQDLSTAQPENLCIIQHKHQMGLYGPWTMCPTPETRILKGSVPGCENHGTRDDDRRRHDDKNIKFLRTVTVTTSLASRAICVRNIDCYLSVVYTMYGTSAF
jgi:hypothetical protein